MCIRADFRVSRAPKNSIRLDRSVCSVWVDGRGAGQLAGKTIHTPSFLAVEPDERFHAYGRLNRRRGGGNFSDPTPLPRHEQGKILSGLLAKDRKKGSETEFQRAKRREGS